MPAPPLPLVLPGVGAPEAVLVAVVVFATGALWVVAAGAVCAAVDAPPPATEPHQRLTALPPEPSLTDASHPEVGAACGAAALDPAEADWAPAAVAPSGAIAVFCAPKLGTILSHILVFEAGAAAPPDPAVFFGPPKLGTILSHAPLALGM